MMFESWHVAVLIPAKNEEDLLPRCLQSVLKACAYLPTTCTYDVVLVIDSSNDHSFELGQSLLGEQGVVIRTAGANVGLARELSAQVALQRFRGKRDRCWLANTDADSEVPETWLHDQLICAENGIQAIAGIIDIDSFVEHDAHVPERFRQTYHLHPNGTHTHVHGANLGVRADAYLQATGWGNQKTAEDHDLWRRLQLQGSLLLSTTHICVTTSGRRKGRAPDGFADTLAAHNESLYTHA